MARVCRCEKVPMFYRLRQNYGLNMIYFFVYTPAGRYTKKELIIRNNFPLIDSFDFIIFSPLSEFTQKPPSLLFVPMK